MFLQSGSCSWRMLCSDWSIQFLVFNNLSQRRFWVVTCNWRIEWCFLPRSCAIYTVQYILVLNLKICWTPLPPPPGKNNKVTPPPLSPLPHSYPRIPLIPPPPVLPLISGHNKCGPSNPGGGEEG